MNGLIDYLMPKYYFIFQVDSLLGGFVEEMQITPTQFQEAVNDQSNSSVARFQPVFIY
jgi:hypothetical protein